MNAAILVEGLIAALLLAGTFFALVGSIGLLRLSDFMRRLHGPTKASTLGVGSVLLAIMLYQATLGSGLEIRELLITLFLFLSAPISAKMLAKASMASDPESKPPAAPGEDARSR